MSALYNEIEPYAVEWLRNLEAANHIAPGVIDGRSIKELEPRDVAGDGQRHFFAGIGVWSYALRLAAVPDDASVWTGSCPCQPFSAAGKRAGVADERHLWPEWFRLIRECRPSVVFGEQVASADGLAWLDTVRAGLEGEGYAFGAADLCAAGVGAPHIRQRLYFGARLADSPGERLERRGTGEARDGGDATRLKPQRLRDACRLGDSDHEGPQGHGRSLGLDGAEGRHASKRHGAASGIWSNVEWLDCLDGKKRPTQPGLEPLVDGAPSRVGRLRAYGNAISPQVATTFITAFLEAAS